MAAEVLAAGGASVTVYDRMPSAARKFLLAGRGGLNLTHSENIETFLSRYGRATAHLRAAIENFSPADARAWCEGLGQSTFVGTSGRVFPASFKASPLLRAWLRRLDAAGVSLKLRHHWSGWDANGRLSFDTPDGAVTVDADATVLALGGGSWPRLGSDGGWVDTLRSAGIAIERLQPSNCGFRVDWSSVFRDRFEGQPLKRIALAFGGQELRGEAIVTRDGLEGGAVYALSAALRDAIDVSGEALLHINLRPDVMPSAIAARLGTPRGKQSLSSYLRKVLSLSPVAIGLLHEATVSRSERLSALAPDALARLISAVPVRLTGVAPIATAISSAGGISFDGVDAHFMLRRRPGTFIAGEMLDWEAPTGGYLLQACFATGAAAGTGVLDWLARGQSEGSR
jgi:uncharacterized flavoprotein (TIGR03862 family)